jgi:hypothetical protein
MKQKPAVIQARRGFLKTLPITANILLAACRSKDPRSVALSYRMGERATAGKLIYNITHSEWKASLGEGNSIRVPAHRFLVLTATITNSGSEVASMPLLSLFDASGKSYRELENGEGVTGWLGLLRFIKPVETLQGAMLFDLPLASYKLQITDGADPEREAIAYVDIPLHIESDPVMSEPPAIAPEKKQ